MNFAIRALFIGFGMVAAAPPLMAQPSGAGVPTVLNYQGRVLNNGLPFNGTGQFVFALVDGGGQAIWNNWQGRDPGGVVDPGSEPDAVSRINVAATPVEVQVRNGNFSVGLGSDPAGVNKPIGSDVFFDSTTEPPRTRQGMKLRVWFSPDGGSFSRLEPDFTFASVPYAMVAAVAEEVRSEAISADMLTHRLVGQQWSQGGIWLRGNPVDPGLQSDGYIRHLVPVTVDGESLFLFQKTNASVHRFTLAKPDGSELPGGAGNLAGFTVTDNPGEMVLTFRNLGNQVLTGLSASFDGAHAVEFSHQFGALDVPAGGTTNLTITLAAGPLARRYANLRVSTHELPIPFEVPLVGVKVENSQVPGGNFAMGRVMGDTDADAPPVTVTIGSFEIQKTEVSKAQWDEVRLWASTHGYPDLAPGDGKSADHPVQNVSWWDVVKWCNARSEMENLTPCYSLDGETLRTGPPSPETTDPAVDWQADGYRLPTEAEWEIAARGGLVGKVFPWATESIRHLQANYTSSSSYPFDLSVTRGFHPDHLMGNMPFTSPVGSFDPNGYGLYDMAGNSSEWCWDWYDEQFYGTTTANPRGPLVAPVKNPRRVFRGGAWDFGAGWARCASRASASPTGNNSAGVLGLRGPFFPSPAVDSSLSVTTSNPDGGIGKGGGNTWTFTGVAPKAGFENVRYYWGSGPELVKISFDGSGFIDNGTLNEILDYDPTQSNLAAGLIIWTGRTRLSNGSLVDVRFKLTLQSLPEGTTPTFVPPDRLGLPVSWGPVLELGGHPSFSVNLLFQARSAEPPTTDWMPAYDYYNNPDLEKDKSNRDGFAYTSFASGFYHAPHSPWRAGFRPVRTLPQP